MTVQYAQVEQFAHDVEKLRLKSLELSFRVASEVHEHPSMQTEWDQIRDYLYTGFTSHIPDPKNRHLKYLSFYGITLEKVKKFEEKYADFTNPSNQENIELRNSLSLNIKIETAFYNLYRDLEFQSTEIPRLRSVASFLAELYDNVLLFMQEKIFSIEVVLDVLYLFDTICQPEVIGELLSPSTTEEEAEVEYILEIVRNCVEQIHIACLQLREEVSKCTEQVILSTPSICGGDPRIKGTRITVKDIVLDYKSGLKPEEISDSWEGLELSQVCFALTYYRQNKDQIEADIIASEEKYDALEASWYAGKSA